MDPQTLASIRARVELELACGQKDLVAHVALPPWAPRAAVAPAAPARLPGTPAPAAAKRFPVSQESVPHTTLTVQEAPREVASRSPASGSPQPAPPRPLPLATAATQAGPAPENETKAERLARRARELAPCTRCALAKGRTQVVYGVGDPDARLMFVGEGPGADEDRLGEPFVGRAGQLLDSIIKNAMGLRREDVYIANIVKCRPPGNRVPQFDEIKECLPFLIEQIEVVKPELIIALGATAATTLLGRQASMSSLRGRFLDFRGTPLLCTYHPAYLLRNPAEKRKVWEDIQLAMQRLGLQRPPREEPPPA